MFGNDCLGAHDIDEFTVDINGNPVEMYVYIDTITVLVMYYMHTTFQTTNTCAGRMAGRMIREINTARRERPEVEGAVARNFIAIAH
jgi:hypothetical protein